MNKWLHRPTTDQKSPSENPVLLSPTSKLESATSQNIKKSFKKSKICK